MKNDKSLEENAEIALEWFEKAANQGDVEAQNFMGDYYFNEENEAHDYKLAIYWYEKAAANDEPRALIELSHRYRDGHFVEQDNSKSFELLIRAANLQEPTALYEYGELLIKEGKDGSQYIEAAADLGNEKAMIYMFEYLDEQKRYKEAYRYAKMLMEADNHEGTRRVADYYYEGKGVSRDKSLARDLYYDASRAGNKEAKEKLRNL